MHPEGGNSQDQSKVGRTEAPTDEQQRSREQDQHQTATRRCTNYATGQMANATAMITVSTPLTKRSDSTVSVGSRADGESLRIGPGLNQ
jgi:hypothetical protein